MPPKRTSTSETPAITLAAIQQLITDGISSALKAQAAIMASASNPNMKQETFRTYTATNGYTGNRPSCKRCTLHHLGPCTVKCQTCNRRKDIMQIGAQKQTTGPQEGVLRDKFTFVHSRISTLEIALEDIQVHH
ncbi:hypothetical protein Tco_0789858 [Tanacetum coccineum]